MYTFRGYLQYSNDISSHSQGVLLYVRDVVSRRMSQSRGVIFKCLGLVTFGVTSRLVSTSPVSSNVSVTSQSREFGMNVSSCLDLCLQLYRLGLGTSTSRAQLSKLVFLKCNLHM